MQELLNFSGLLIALVWLAVTLAFGYPLFCLLRSWSGDELRLDWIELVFISAMLGSLCVGWVAVLLAEVGQFSLVSLGVTGGLLWVATGLGLWLRRASLRCSCSFTPLTWLLAVVFVGALLVFSHPFEFVMGGADAGVYVNLGGNIARTGALLIHEDDLTRLPAAAWPALFRQTPPTAATQYVRLPGFYLSDSIPGLVIPQFFPLHPAWLGIFNAFAGLRASLYATPLWASLAIVAVALALKRAFADGRVGLWGSLVLMMTPIQIYFARYQTAEALTQYLIWGGLYAFVAFIADEKARPLWGVLAAGALGQAFLTRIDVLPLLLAPGGWLLYTIVRGRRRGQLWFFLPLGVLLLHAAIHTVVFSWPYAWEVYGNVLRIGLSVLKKVGWLVVVSGAVAVFIWKKRRLLRLRWESVRRTVRLGLVVSVVLLAVFAYFVWPQLGHTKLAPYWYGGIKIPQQNYLNFQRLGWYLSPLGIWLGVLGIAVMLSAAPARTVWPVAVVGLSFSVIYFYNIMNNPYHIYAMRRYMPVVLPFFAAGIACALTWLWDLRRRWRFASVAALMLGLVLPGWLAYNDRAVWDLIEYRGLIGQLEAMARQLKPGAVLLFEDEASVGAGGTIGTPLQYLYGFTVFDLQEEQIVPEALAKAVRDWQSAGRAVYWVKGPHVPAHSPPFQLAPEASFVIQGPVLEGSYDHFPVRREEYRIPLEFYSVSLDAQSCELPAHIDVGTLDSLYLRDGFYDKELWSDTTVRWTAGTAVVDLPCLPHVGSQTVSLVMRVASGRPANLAFSSPLTMSVELDGALLGEWALGSDFQTVEVEVLASKLYGAGHTLTLTSATWVPQDYGIGADSRALGLVVDSIGISLGGDLE